LRTFYFQLFTSTSTKSCRFYCW